MAGAELRYRTASGGKLEGVAIPIRAILRQRCPRCREGPIFRFPLWRGPLATHERCPVCGFRYEREPGYFLGAMYFSYALSIPPGLGIVLLLWRLTGWHFDVVMLWSFVAYLPFVPAVSRWSRVLWLYLDQRFDPQK
jgi:uncharacterized protein (DUF983 family)